MTPEEKAREILAIIKPPNAYSEIDVEHVAQALRDVERETLERAAKVAEAEESTRSGDQVYPCIAIAAVIRSLMKSETAA